MSSSSSSRRNETLLVILHVADVQPPSARAHAGLITAVGRAIERFEEACVLVCAPDGIHAIRARVDGATSIDWLLTPSTSESSEASEASETESESAEAASEAASASPSTVGSFPSSMRVPELRDDFETMREAAEFVVGHFDEAATEAACGKLFELLHTSFVEPSKTPSKTPSKAADRKYVRARHSSLEALGLGLQLVGSVKMPKVDHVRVLIASGETALSEAALEPLIEPIGAALAPLVFASLGVVELGPAHRWSGVRRAEGSVRPNVVPVASFVREHFAGTWGLAIGVAHEMQDAGLAFARALPLNPVVDASSAASSPEDTSDRGLTGGMARALLGERRDVVSDDWDGRAFGKCEESVEDENEQFGGGLADATSSAGSSTTHAVHTALQWAQHARGPWVEAVKAALRPTTTPCALAQRKFDLGVGAVDLSPSESVVEDDCVMLVPDARIAVSETLREAHKAAVDIMSASSTSASASSSTTLRTTLPIAGHIQSTFSKGIVFAPPYLPRGLAGNFWAQTELARRTVGTLAGNASTEAGWTKPQIVATIWRNYFARRLVQIGRYARAVPSPRTVKDLWTNGLRTAAFVQDPRDGGPHLWELVAAEHVLACASDDDDDDVDDVCGGDEFVARQSLKAWRRGRRFDAAAVAPKEVVLDVDATVETAASAATDAAAAEDASVDFEPFSESKSPSVRAVERLAWYLQAALRVNIQRVIAAASGEKAKSAAADKMAEAEALRAELRAAHPVRYTVKAHGARKLDEDVRKMMAKRAKASSKAASKSAAAGSAVDASDEEAAGGGGASATESKTESKTDAEDAEASASKAAADFARFVTAAHVYSACDLHRLRKMLERDCGFDFAESAWIALLLATIEEQTPRVVLVEGTTYDFGSPRFLGRLFRVWGPAVQSHMAEEVSSTHGRLARAQLRDLESHDSGRVRTEPEAEPEPESEGRSRRRGRGERGCDAIASLADVWRAHALTFPKHWRSRMMDVVCCATSTFTSSETIGELVLRVMRGNFRIDDEVDAREAASTAAKLSMPMKTIPSASAASASASKAQDRRRRRQRRAKRV